MKERFKQFVADLHLDEVAEKVIATSAVVAEKSAIKIKKVAKAIALKTEKKLLKKLEERAIDRRLESLSIAKEKKLSQKKKAQARKSAMRSRRRR